MKQLFTLLLSIGVLFSAQANLIITGIMDGPLSGGTKVIEVYVTQDVADMSIYGFGLANNGGGTDGQEYTFPADAATAGTFIYFTNNAENFTAYLGFDADYEDGDIGGFNGDDAIELYENGAIIDIFGDVDTDGTGTTWEHLDSWAYRLDGTGPDGSTFVESNWSIQAPDMLDNTNTNAEATTPFPYGTYSYDTPANPSVSFIGADASVNEADGTVEISLGIAAPNGTATSVDVAVDMDNSSADAGDYSFTNTTVTFPANDATEQTVTVSLTDDTEMESIETIVLTLSNATNGATLGNNATFTISISDNDTPIPSLVINEINYNGPGDDSLEYIEIYNNGTETVDMSGFTFANALVHAFATSTPIQPGEYFLLCKDAQAFQSALSITAMQWDDGSLSNGGETIEFYDASGNLIDMVAYEDGGAFPSEADGSGPSLELCSPDEDNNDGNYWFAGSTAIEGNGLMGTPGAANTAECLSFIPARISFVDPVPFGNELYNEDAGTLTFEIALEQGGESPVNVSIAVEPGTATEGEDFTFASPVTLTFPANTEAPDTLAFTLDIMDDTDMEVIEGFRLTLSSPDATTELGDSIIIISIADNDTPAETHLVINEFMYNNPGDDVLEFLEIFNSGTEEIDLGNARFLDGIYHVFPEGTSIAAGEYLVICNDSTAFADNFGFSAEAWDAGGLKNSGELIQLYDRSGQLADEVDYSDGDPFPTEPDGDGPSLSLCDPSQDNNDANYWFPSLVSANITVEGVEIFATPGADNGIGCDGSAVSNDKVFAGQVNLFPNPAYDVLTVQTDIVLDEVRMLNVLGQTVSNKFNVQGTENFNVSQLPAGVYFVVMTSGKTSKTIQVVVE